LLLALPNDALHWTLVFHAINQAFEEENHKFNAQNCHQKRAVDCECRNCFRNFCQRDLFCDCLSRRRKRAKIH
jgi:hypothetical protein